MKIRYFVLLLFGAITSINNAFAGVHVTAEVQPTVAVGDQFRLSFTVNTQDVSNFKAPNIKGFEVLMGPSRSTQSSIQIINGHTSQSSSITFTFILYASRAGSYTIPGATVVVGNESYTSNSVHVKVLASSNGGSQNSPSPKSNASVREQYAGSRITGKDLFITVTANKKRVREQEAVLLTYKVYALVDLVQLQGKMPDLQGFHTQEVNLPQQKSFKMERYNGRNYATVVWSEYVMFPQQSGKLTVPPIKFDGIVVQQNRSQDPIDAFFNGTSSVEVKKSIIAPGITLQVDPLPSPHPANFSGGVGKFSISSSINTKKIKTNEPLNFRVVVSGMGNMKLLKTPQVLFPKDFETYDPKITDKTSLSTDGLSGNVIYDFLAVPRHTGKYTIPSVQFTYYDVTAHVYKTIKTESYDINVEKGNNSGSNSAYYADKEDLKTLAEDIRYIKTGNVKMHQPEDTFFGSWRYLVCYLFVILLFSILWHYFRRNRVNNSNSVLARGRKANKVATKRLRIAHRLLSESKIEPFYDELLKTLWGYVADKLYIAIANLNKDNVAEKLRAKNVDEELIQSFINLLNDCEFARYAPGDANHKMDEIYDQAINVISKMENNIKK